VPALKRKIHRRDLLRGYWRRPDGWPAVVRPPGAAAAERFHHLCDGCGECASTCPAGAIRMTGPKTALAGHSPQIKADEAPCVMCEGLVCSDVCLAGALKKETPDTMRIAEIAFRAEDCLAHQGFDADCGYCFERCPLRGKAIAFQRGHGPELDPGECTGCGTCVFFCPAQPKALSPTPL
jgi:ferredoxin-type protein NapG